jgi:hypothetical protein
MDHLAGRAELEGVTTGPRKTAAFPQAADLNSTHFSCILSKGLEITFNLGRSSPYYRTRNCRRVLYLGHNCVPSSVDKAQNTGTSGFQSYFPRTHRTFGSPQPSLRANGCDLVV